MIRRLIRNAGWNLAGQGVPMVVALVSIPLLIRALGDDRFGFVSIAWIVVGYFSVLDLGIGRALTHAVAGRLAKGDEVELGDLIGTGLGALLILGVVTGAGLAATSSWIVHSVIDLAPGLRAEGVRALLILGAAVPFVLLTAGLRGILEAHGRFRVVNIVQMPTGALLYAVPVVVARVSPSLVSVLLSMALVRVFSCGAFLAACAWTVRGFRRLEFNTEALRGMMRFGGWMTVTNVASPIMVNMDRLFIGSLLSVGAVTYYVTPFEVVSKLLLLPSALASVVFPELTRMASADHVAQARRYVVRSLAVLLAVLVPAAGIAAAVAHPLLAWWVSPELAARSAPIMQLLALGVVINGAAYIPFAWIQAGGRSDITARFHVIELVVYIPTLILLIGWLGLTGVAVAWVLRVTLDSILLFGYAWRRFYTFRP
jgi:O-antigen/teichoic acid export membrane protein